MEKKRLSLFITFEGVEGSGKTTQIRRLKQYLTRQGIPCAVTREPGGCPISEKIRKILLHPDHRGMSPLAELFLYEAARAQHVKDIIEPQLVKGVTVLCDRFYDATTAYQGHSRRLSLDLVLELNRLAAGRAVPDLTILLDLPSRVGLERALQRNRTRSLDREARFEQEALAFHERVRKGYLAIARREPERVKRIDARQGEEKVFEKIRQVVDGLLGRPRPAE
jgi:dTMP kinase